jgi:hypothetical protein
VSIFAVGGRSRGQRGNPYGRILGFLDRSSAMVTKLKFLVKGEKHSVCENLSLCSDIKTFYVAKFTTLYVVDRKLIDELLLPEAFVRKWSWPNRRSLPKFLTVTQIHETYPSE